MANAFLKPEVIAAQALGLLQREIVLPRTVVRMGLADFAGAKDDTVNVRVPMKRTARTRTVRATTVLVADDFTETSVPVVLSTHVYDLANITDAELTLDIKDFGMQVLMPQIRGVVEAMEDVIATALGAADWDATAIDFAEGVDEPYDIAIDCAKALNDRNVPRSNRFLVVGSSVEAAFLKSDKLSKVNEAGTDSALREAVIGRVGGFTVLGSNALAEDEAYAYHGSAIAFANVAPSIPQGAAFGSGQSSEGLALRWLKDYDPTYARDRSLVDAFVGASSVEEGVSTKNYRGVAINFTAGS